MAILVLVLLTTWGTYNTNNGYCYGTFTSIGTIGSVRINQVTVSITGLKAFCTVLDAWRGSNHWRRRNSKSGLFYIFW